MTLQAELVEVEEFETVDTVFTVLDLDKIRALRLQKGLSQEDAARAAGLAGRQHWSEIESGRRANVTVETLDRIAKALGVTAKELLE